MESQAKYIENPKFEGKSELFRVYYDSSLISFDLFLWIEQYAIEKSIKEKNHIFKAFPINNLDPILICKN
jgi:hypothetical protein